MKKLLPSYILAFLIGFMFFVYEPLNMYATNVNDFWFDIFIIIKPITLIFLGTGILIASFYTAIYFINKHFSENLKVYKAFVIIGIIFFIALYIQGNFLIGNLPHLDGTEINWNSYLTENIISAVIWVLVICIFIGVTIKFKYDKVIKGYTFILCAIFVMLTVSLLTVITKPEVLRKKDSIKVLTSNNINQASTKKNFYIFLVDAVDSQIFDDVLNKSDYKDTFTDFTYYPDTMCGYPFTRDSIPFIFSGIWNENETEFQEYYNKAFDNAKIFDELKKEDYNINFYDDDFKWTGSKVSNIDNVVELERKINILSYIKQTIKYNLFKYLPYQLKPIAKIETMNFNNCKMNKQYEEFIWDDKAIFERIETNDIEKIDENYFNFTHIEGGHVPFNYDKDLNEITNGTYEQKLEGTLHIINSYINRLKNSDVYDNSVIIIMADHGYNYYDYVGRQNPILYIKGIDEHHEMIKSDIPVSYEDLADEYLELLKGKSSQELFKNIDYSRKRRFLLYEYTKEDKMVEYEQNGKAWDETTLLPTGKEFNR